MKASSPSIPSMTASASRIPLSLQKIFIRSNRGLSMENVAPPPNKVASKVFFSSWKMNDKKDKKKDTKNEMMKAFDDAVDGASLALAAQRDKLIDQKRNKNYERSCPRNLVSPIVKIFTKFHGKCKTISPQVCLDDIMQSRGYPLRKKKTMDSEDYAISGSLHRPSGDKSLYLIDLAEGGKDEDIVRLVLEDSNLCLFAYSSSRGDYGETLLHMICRYCNNPKTLATFVQRTGVNINVSDDHGRTPLHYVCWRSKILTDSKDDPACLGMVDVIIREKSLAEIREMFLMTDIHGNTPLMYITENYWTTWNKYLISKKDEWWNTDSAPKTGSEKVEPTKPTSGTDTTSHYDSQQILSSPLKKNFDSTLSATRGVDSDTSESSFVESDNDNSEHHFNFGDGDGFDTTNIHEYNSDSDSEVTSFDDDQNFDISENKLVRETMLLNFVLF